MGPQACQEQRQARRSGGDHSVSGGIGTPLGDRAKQKRPDRHPHAGRVKELRHRGGAAPGAGLIHGVLEQGSLSSGLPHAYGCGSHQQGAGMRHPSEQQDPCRQHCAPRQSYRRNRHAVQQPAGEQPRSHGKGRQWR